MWEQTLVRIYVGSLSYNTTDQDLVDLFGQVGEVVSATVITDRDSGRSKGFGFVEMSDDAAARKAIDQFNGTTLGDRTIVEVTQAEDGTIHRITFRGRRLPDENNIRPFGSGFGSDAIIAAGSAGSADGVH